MLEESGVHLMLSTFASDPVAEGTQIQGLFVENKSGRRAVRAGVVIDATGEADMVRRAGGAALYPGAQNPLDSLPSVPLCRFSVDLRDLTHSSACISRRYRPLGPYRL